MYRDEDAPLFALQASQGAYLNFTVANAGWTAWMGALVVTFPFRTALEGTTSLPPVVREPLTTAPAPNVTSALLSRLPTLALLPKIVVTRPRFATSPSAPAGGQLDLRPLQIAQLGRPQAVAIANQDHSRVPMAVAAGLPGGRFPL